MKEYQLKLIAERRQQKTADIEAEVRLQTHFTQLMNLANARGGYVTSEAAIKHALEKVGNEKTSPSDLRGLVENLGILNVPVGAATQDAAIAAIASLTLRFEALREPRLQALRSLSNPPLSRFANMHLENVEKALEERRQNTAD